MLESLLVRNYVLIDSLEIDFPENLIIITGQTGAGKSVLLGALGLVLGGKADASMISEGADSCVVEARFRTEDTRIRELLDDAGAEWDGGALLIRRIVSRSGRSRAFVNDCPVSVSVLQACASRLVDIHSQHQTTILRDKGFQLSMLDAFAGCGAELSRCSEAWRKLLALRVELSSAKEALAKARCEADYARAQLGQLDKARLVDGEMEELEAEQKALSNAEEIKGDLGAVCGLMSPPESSGALSVDSILKEASRLLGKVGGYVPEAEALRGRMDSARIELADILDAVSAADGKVEVSPQRLRAVDDRLSLLYGLLGKFSCGTVAELIAVREGFSAQLSDTTALEGRIAGLEKAVAQEESEYHGLCETLHGLRTCAAPRFAHEIEVAVRSLELDRAVFEVDVLPASPSGAGTDAVLFRFSSTGRNAVDVAGCASGGELSRIMLCLKAIMARYANMPTLIFDEIDTGVSGSAADKMGSMICSMGADMQVFAITHLPQVAAKGTAHYLVEKSAQSCDSDAGRIVTTIRRIVGEERVMEIARMLSGAVISQEAVANAKALLG